jgi:uncharacterized membrane protein YdjX (TVP38/TMEM64 family)
VPSKGNGAKEIAGEDCHSRLTGVYKSIVRLFMKRLPLIIGLSVLGILVACYFFIPSFRQFINVGFDVLTSNDERKVKAWVSQFGMAGPLILMLTMVVQMFLFVVPNIFVMMVAILMYGPVFGSIISLAGVFGSSSVGYLIGTKLGPVTIEKLLSKRTLQKATSFIKEYGVAAIAITRVSSLSNDSLSIVAGALKMRYKNYILATICGITPLVVLLAIYGKNGKILKALIWIAVTSLVVLIVYVIIDKKKRKKQARQT